MIKTKLNKRIARLVSLITLLVLTFAGAVSATVCWFGSSRNLKVMLNNISVISKDDAYDYDLTYKVYKFDDKTKKGVLNKSGSDFTFKMDPFDNFIDSRNEYLSQIVEFTITCREEHPAGGYVYFDLVRTQNFLSSEGTNMVAAYISNVVKFDACLYSYTLNTGGDPVTYFNMGNVNRYIQKFEPSTTEGYADDNDKIYQEVRYHLDNDTTGSKYSYISEADIKALPKPTDTSAYTKAMKAIDTSKPSKIEIQVDKEKGYKYQLPLNYKTATFYLRYDYSQVLTSFFANNQNATVIEPSASGSSISVLNDISNIKIRIKG